MADINSPEQPQNQPQNPGRRTFLKGFGFGAAAGAAGATGMWGVFSGGKSPEPGTQVHSSAPGTAAAEAAPAIPTPDTSGVKSRVWKRERPDGTLAYTYPITPEERKDLERDVDNVGRAIKEVLDADALKASGVDVDQVVSQMKTWDDKKISEWAHRSNTDRGRFDDLEEVSLDLGDTGISAWYVDDPKTGEFGALWVSLSVDGDGKYAKLDPNNFRYESSGTQDGLLSLPKKLLPLVKAPNGASSEYSHEKLNYSSHMGRKEDGTLEVFDLSSITYPTGDGQLYSLSMQRQGPGYFLYIQKHKPDVDLTIRGKSSPIQLP